MLAALGGRLLERYLVHRDEADLLRATELYREAQRRSPSGGDEYLAGIAACLRLGPIAPATPTTSRREWPPIDSASDIRKRAPVEILHAAAEWSEWALERRAWEEAAESGLLGLAASNRAAVHELGPGPAARFDVTPQLDQLVVAGLLGGASGTKDRRPALDALMKDAKRRRFDVLVVWRLDRLGRNLKHLVTLLEDVQAVGIAFV